MLRRGASRKPVNVSLFARQQPQRCDKAGKEETKKRAANISRVRSGKCLRNANAQRCGVGERQRERGRIRLLEKRDWNDEGWTGEAAMQRIRRAREKGGKGGEGRGTVCQKRKRKLAGLLVMAFGLSSGACLGLALVRMSSEKPGGKERKEGKWAAKMGELGGATRGRQRDDSADASPESWHFALCWFPPAHRFGTLGDTWANDRGGGHRGTTRAPPPKPRRSSRPAAREKKRTKKRTRKLNPR